MTLQDLFATIEARKTADPASSWTAQLLAKGPGEMRGEVRRGSGRGDHRSGEGRPGGAHAEAADVLYHLMVMLVARDVSLDAVLAELERRQQQSGLSEKAGRA